MHRCHTHPELIPFFCMLDALLRHVGCDLIRAKCCMRNLISRHYTSALLSD